MDELQVGGVKGYASDALFLGFFRLILPVADDRMTDRGKLDANLVL